MKHDTDNGGGALSQGDSPKNYSKEYLAYLESQHWHDLRQEAINRANRKCEACSGTKSLCGHHLIYRAPLESCTVEDIMALCLKCHERWHEWLRKEHRHLQSFCRQSTRGALVVLMGTPIPVIKKIKAATPKKVLVPGALTKKEKKEKKRRERAEAREVLLQIPGVKDLIYGAQTKIAFRRGIRQLLHGRFASSRNFSFVHDMFAKASRGKGKIIP